MRYWFPVLAFTAIGAALALFYTGRGQEKGLASKPSNRNLRPLQKAAKSNKIRNITKLPILQRQMYLSAQSGTAWLLRANRADGRFVYGFEPSLRLPSTADNYVHQVAAVYALARAGNFFENGKAVAVARQSLLTLLLETEQDPQDPKSRRPVLMIPGLCDLEAAGWLVMAINELRAPGKDLLAKSNELCNFIRSRQRADGSFSCTVDEKNKNNDRENARLVNRSTGPVLYGLVRSLQHRKSDATIAAVRKALPYYRSWWREQKNMEMTPWHTAAYGEAFLLTKEQPFADCVNEMSDWLCTLQYNQLDPRHMRWLGGFKDWNKSQLYLRTPDVHSAVYMEGLSRACRVARQTGDLRRFQTYKEALESCGQFIMKLQYSSANTQHFAEWYRADIAGAFHESDQVGSLRIDYTQQAVSGLTGYLADVARINEVE